MKGVFRISGVALLAGAMLVAGQAFGQEETPAGPVAPEEPVDAKGVGISGGIILGAEVVLVLEAIIDVEPVWPWIVFPILGAAGGGVGGYFVEQASPEGAVAMLVSSMVFLIPTAVAVSASTAYDPESEGAIEDTSGGGAYSFELSPGAEPDEAGTTTEVVSQPESVPEGAPAVPPETEEPAPAPETEEPEAPSPEEQRLRHLTSGSLLHVGSDLDTGFGIPAIDVRPTAFTREDAMLGVDQGLQIHVPLVKIDLP
jgi:hypothetical protein